MMKPEKRRLLKEAKKERVVGKKHFESAGYLFEKIKMLRHAASCFFTAETAFERARFVHDGWRAGGQGEAISQIAGRCGWPPLKF